MKISDVFKEVRKGVNLEQSKYYKNIDDDLRVYTFKKNAIDYGVLLQTRFDVDVVSNNISGGFIMKPDDIIISVKRPYKVGMLYNEVDKKVVITSNYIILRGLDDDKYSLTFIVNYLDKIGIEKYIRENRSEISRGYYSDITIDEVMNIELPDIPLNKQQNFDYILTSLNKRNTKHAMIMDNDNQLINKVLDYMVGEDDGLE